MRLYPLLAGAWCAVMWFFTFGVAWNLFRLFPRERAGEVTTALFPTYFAVAIAIGAAATAALLPLLGAGARAKTALALQLLALAALAAIPLFIQPAMALHAPGTPGFARWHGISMALNLVALVAVPVAAALVVTASRDGN